MSSIKPFLHTTTTTSKQQGIRGNKSSEKKRETEEHEEKFETIEKTVLASSQLTAGHGRDTELQQGSHQSDALMSGGLRIEWGMVTYVLFRDQVSLFSFKPCEGNRFNLCFFFSRDLGRLPTTSRCLVGYGGNLPERFVGMESGKTGS